MWSSKERINGLGSETIGIGDHLFPHLFLSSKKGKKEGRIYSGESLKSTSVIRGDCPVVV